ncbi:hypothetical protein CVT25_014169 [Psilocybe cyanescens]|uniref:Reverse transcriptase domain-containing protein n=1 Tax=Psilocybe cyanescens TaxID=93625 RepID=A0A409XUN2_PSICY|nr:hypothetical protein CVT25_014169 [Psilocybe cyanescens]
MEIRATSKETQPVIPPGEIKTEKVTAGLGTEIMDAEVEVHRTANTATISAHFADLPSTMLSPADCNFLPIVTPLVANAWESLLRHEKLFNTFSDVPFSIRNGFDMGIQTNPSTTYTPPNHTSALKHPHAVLSHIQKELSLGRYTGPFSRSRLELLIGPFRTSPLGIVLKAGTADEYRLVQDFSFPRNDQNQISVNSEINIDNFRCDWGTFDKIATIVRDSPPFSEAATLDVDAAFRRIPIRPSQQSSFIIGWQDLYYIDHAAPFGAASSGGVFGRTADALMAVFRSRAIIAANWVDDFVFFRSSKPNISTSPPPTSMLHSYYTLETIYSITSPLGWPWKLSKTRPFAEIFKYLGFLWSLKHKTVQIPDDKKTRYLEKLLPWVKDQKFTLQEAESIFGTLVHCSLAVPEGRSRLPALSRFVSSFSRSTSPFIRRSPNISVLNDITWWRECLKQKFCGSSLAPPPPQSPVEFWVDASTDWGIGIVFNGEWNSWKLRKNWKANGRNIGWAEFVAIEIGLLHAIHLGHTNVHFLIRSDNQGVIEAIKGGKSRSAQQNTVLQQSVPKHLRFPTDEFVLCAFAASGAGISSHSTIHNKISALRAWHNTHGAQWKGGPRLHLVLNGVKNLTPASSKRPPRPPINAFMLTQLIGGLDLTSTLDSAVAACASIAFWGQCRLGELLPSSSLDLSTHYIPSRKSLRQSKRNKCSHILSLPRTKTNKRGEDIILTRQINNSDPLHLLRNHLHISNLHHTSPLFAYMTPSGPRSLTKYRFLARCNTIWKIHGYPRTTGHCFRIGGTTELLLAGVPPDIVKTMGRWSSDSFLRYWRFPEDIVPQHTQNIATSRKRKRTSARRTVLEMKVPACGVEYHDDAKWGSPFSIAIGPLRPGDDAAATPPTSPPPTHYLTFSIPIYKARRTVLEMKVPACGVEYHDDAKWGSPFSIAIGPLRPGDDAAATPPTSPPPTHYLTFSIPIYKARRTVLEMSLSAKDLPSHAN